MIIQQPRAVLVRGRSCDFRSGNSTVVMKETLANPDSDVIAKSIIIKQGKSIAFTKAELFQNDKLIATASATNKLV